jgi:hypothetical protein
MAVIQVNTVAQARPRFQQVCQWAARIGMRFYGIPIEVRLREPRTQDPGHKGTTLHSRLWRGRKLIRNRIRAIEIVKGLDPLEFQRVVAHELGHVWLSLHRVQVPGGLDEGFCELVAYRFCCDQGTPQALSLASQIAANPDPQYGEAFRRVSSMVGPKGLEQVLKDRRFIVNNPAATN